MSSDSGRKIEEKRLDIVLFVDESIDYDFNVSSSLESTKVANATEPVAGDIWGEVKDLTMPYYYVDSPKLLAEQISLPIQDVERLCFYETFMVSKILSKCDSLIPNPDEIEEIGNCCVTVEELDDGTFLIFSTLRMGDDCGHLNTENLSVVDENLKVLQEKRIQRSTHDGKSQVRHLSILLSWPLINFNFYFR